MKAILVLLISSLLVSSCLGAKVIFSVEALTTCILNPTPQNCNLITLLGGSIGPDDDIELNSSNEVFQKVNITSSITARSLVVDSAMKSLTVLKGVSLNLAQGLEVAGAAVVDVAGAIVANTKTAIKDTAQFVVENGASITFNGGVDVAAGGVFTVRTNATVNINGNSVLNGTVNLAENAYFNIKSGIVTAANTIQSEANTTINGALVFAAAAATYAQNKGTLLLDGAAAVINATTVTIANNAWLKGNGGSINGNLNIAAGGGIAIGNSPGTQYVNGNFALSSTSTFDLEIASASNYDKLVVRGTAAVDGILVGHLLNNYQPAAGERYTFITAVGKVSGGFNIVRGNDLANLGKFSTQVNEHTVDAYYANSAATAVASFFLMAIAFAFATL